jgi:molecular chaperone GrpE
MSDIDKKSDSAMDAEKEEFHSEASGEEQPSSEECEKLRKQLEVKEREARENYDRFLRQTAELENFKKRMAREKAEAIRYANEALIRDLLQVVDNLERAVEHAQGGGNGQSLLDGVEMILKGFLDILARHGVTPVPAKGKSFDPEKHEAIAQVETDQVAPNTVVEEHHKGYYLLDRLLRPSLVSVAKRPEEKKRSFGANGEVENKKDDD